MRIIAATALALTFAASPASAPAFAQVIPNTAEQPGQAEPARIRAGTFQVDPAHTQVSWTVNQLGFSMLGGMFGASGGSITIDPAKLADARVEVTFQIDAMNVTDAAFATHLRSSDFFDATRYPTARFVSTSVRRARETPLRSWGT
jgi:polyisoprenoid-binding protein YceI